MNWTTSEDLQRQLKRYWERGDLLRSLVSGATLFPVQLVCKGPSSREITDNFAQVRAWIEELKRTPYIQINWQDVRHRVQGSQRLPSTIVVECENDAYAWLDLMDDRRVFIDLLEMTRSKQAGLLPWLERNPLQALQLAPVWHLLLDVVGWMQQHPAPGIYLRQVDIPGVQSKFIERHRAVLSEWFDCILPESVQIPAKSGVSQFAARYGFLEKPVRIRFRLLDPEITLFEGIRGADITLDAPSFCQLKLPIRNVLITENEINFLSLPHLKESMAIFGAGYGWDALGAAHWLREKALYYWGDIDTHGFAILDRLRDHYPQVCSILMDRATLDAHRSFWGTEQQPYSGRLERLTADEQDLFQDLQADRIRQGLRLEQEHLGFAWVCQALNRLPVINRKRLEYGVLVNEFLGDSSSVGLQKGSEVP